MIKSYIAAPYIIHEVYTGWVNPENPVKLTQNLQKLLHRTNPSKIIGSIELEQIISLICCSTSTLSSNMKL